MSAMESNVRWVLGVKVVDRHADPIQFAFERAIFDQDTVYLEVSQHAWAQMGPFQSAGYLIDTYFQKFPEEETRVGHRVATTCVMHALWLDRS